MIKFFLGAIIALALIGGAIKFDSDENSWKLIVIKQEALHSVQNGGIRIYKIRKRTNFRFRYLGFIIDRCRRKVRLT